MAGRTGLVWRCAEDLLILRYPARHSEVFLMGSVHQDGKEHPSNIHTSFSKHFRTCDKLHELISHVQPTLLSSEICLTRLCSAEVISPEQWTNQCRIPSVTGRNVSQVRSPFWEKWIHRVLRSKLRPVEEDSVDEEDENEEDEEFTEGAELIEAFRIAQQRQIPFLPLDRSLAETWSELLIQWRQSIPAYFAFRQSYEQHEYRSVYQDTALLQQYPALFEIYIHSRDLHMARNLLTYCSNTRHQRVVAVVGKGHIEGIGKAWEQNLGQA